MFIEKEKWNKLLNNFNILYSNYDRFDDNVKDMIDNIDECIDNIKENHSNKIYVIANNAIVDDEIDYSIYDVSIDREEAKK